MIVAAVLFASFFILLIGILLGLSTVLVVGGALLSVAQLILTAAIALPGIKSAVIKELPELENVKCGRLPSYIEAARAHATISEIINHSLRSKAAAFGFVEFDSSGKTQVLFGNPEFQNLNLEEFAKSGEKGVPILILDTAKLQANPGVISSNGPIYVYNSGSTDLALSLRSKTAIVFCNENLDSRGWRIDSPVVVASRPEDARDRAEIANSTTADGDVNLVPFESLRAAVKTSIVRILNGDPIFEAGGEGRIREDLRIMTISPTKNADTQTPAATEGEAAAKLNEEVPEEIQVEGASGIDKRLTEDPYPEDLTSAQLAWQKVSCNLGVLYVRCQESFDAKDLQHFIKNSLKKKNGSFVAHKKYGPVTLDFEITNPRVFFKNHKLGVLVDVTVLNTSAAAGEKHDSTLNERLHDSSGPGLASKLEDLARVGMAGKNAYQNAKRSLALSVPRKIIIRDAEVSIGSLVYDKETGFFHLSQPQLKDFELSVPNMKIPATLGGFKPFIVSSINEYLASFFNTHPAFDLKNVKVYGLPLGWFLVESVRINEESDKAEASLRFGYQFF